MGEKISLISPAFLGHAGVFFDNLKKYPVALFLCSFVHWALLTF